ncbi:MAG TPA: hypothetical protein VF021_07960, partial [Longimicrobiales bacterium]
MVAVLPGLLAAQSFRVSGTTTARYIDVKPITTQKPVSTIPLTQDLTINAWGFGTGLRVYSQLRARAAAGDVTDLWPQSNDHFDVLSAFGEYDRNKLRVRAGRQWKSSPLGFYNYDGASVLIRASRVVRAEVYGGWSLLAGESDNYGSAVADAIEPFKPDEKRNIIGAEVQLHFAPGVNFSTLYQREIRTDRAGLYSERLAGDASVRLGLATLDGGVQANLGAKNINQARVQLSAPLFSRISGSIEARRYRPYFDLWTIWGMFNPIGFREALANARWANAQGTASLHLGGGLRSYDDDNGGVEFERLRSDGWRAVADAAWTPRSLLTLAASYQADIGFGASKSDGSLTARLNLGESSYLSASALAFQTVHEMDIREGTVYGVGTDAAFKLSGTSRVGWSAAVYQHDNASPADEINWSQVRGSLWLEWTIGTNPDTRRVAQRTP